jgi:hypothetical protein
MALGQSQNQDYDILQDNSNEAHVRFAVLTPLALNGQQELHYLCIIPSTQTHEPKQAAFVFRS